MKEGSFMAPRTASQVGNTQLTMWPADRSVTHPPTHPPPRECEGSAHSCALLNSISGAFKSIKKSTEGMNKRLSA